MILFISGCDDINNSFDTDFTNNVVEKNIMLKSTSIFQAILYLVDMM